MTPDQTRLLEYFIQRTDMRLQKIEVKIDQLINFKMKVIGMATVGVSVGVAIVELIKIMAFK